jgi:hypothetical protein
VMVRKSEKGKHCNDEQNPREHQGGCRISWKKQETYGQNGETLTDGVVKTLETVGMAFCFRDNAMTFGG